MKLGLILIALLALPALPVQAATTSKSYSYFTIGGSTLAQIEKELARRGPKVASTGARHPGATQMEFNSRIGYADKGTSCAVTKVRVSVKAKVILPRWTRPRAAEADVRLVWDALSSDIKRHEESHIVIAQSHSRDLEQALAAIRPQKSCAAAAAKAKAVTARVLASHDRAQERFDRVEGRNFEKRILKLIEYRLQRGG
jgi:predicted secreted Zn-dependent protease